eukprot:TRINITY_DN920_c0_g1_i2.p1 TRINITY_DN920_c0_g1~~TRINITY_DN920_c0_g1_i2.p1  ORF type:complete len:142 (-),score=26.82 TRINITY_DN920_c0_g1_i2:188-613(-)
MDSLSIADVIEDLDVLGRSSVKSVLSSTSPETGRHDRCNRNAIADKDARVDAQLLSNAGNVDVSTLSSSDVHRMARAVKRERSSGSPISPDDPHAEQEFVKLDKWKRAVSEELTAVEEKAAAIKETLVAVREKTANGEPCE